MLDAGADLTVSIGASISPSVAKAFEAIEKRTASLDRLVGRLDKSLKAFGKVMASNTRALTANTAAMGRTNASNNQLVQSQNRLSQATATLGRNQARQTAQATAAANAASRLATATRAAAAAQTRMPRGGGGLGFSANIGGGMASLGSLGALAGGGAMLSGPIEMEQTLKILETKLTDNSAASMAALKKEAMRLGSGNSIFNPSQVTQSFVDLAAGGMEKDDILGNAKTIIDIATANQIRDVAEVADLTTNILTSFYGRSGKQPANVTKFADTIQYVADKTSAGFMDMAWAAKYAAPSFKMAGWGMEDMSAILGVLADNSIKGMDAGTDLQGMVARLASMTKDEKEGLKSKGFSGKNAIFDAKGNLRNVIDVFQSFKNVTDKMGSSQKIELFKGLVGQENLKSMSILTEQFSSLKEIRDSLNQVPAGETSSKAAKQMETLSGKMLKAKGAAAGLASVVYDQLKPTLEALVDAGTKSALWATSFAEAHPNVTKLIVGLVALKGALAAVNLVGTVGGMLGMFAGPGGGAAAATITGGVTKGFAMAWPVVRAGLAATFSPVGILGIAAAGLGTAIGLAIFEKGLKPAMDKARAEAEALFDKTVNISSRGTVGAAALASAQGASTESRSAVIGQLSSDMRKAFAAIQEDDRRKAIWASGKALPQGVRPMDKVTRESLDTSFYGAAERIKGIRLAAMADEKAQAALSGTAVTLDTPGEAARIADALLSLKESGAIAAAQQQAKDSGKPSNLTLTINNNGIALDEVLTMTREQIIDAVRRGERQSAHDERHSRTGVPASTQ